MIRTEVCYNGCMSDGEATVKPLEHPKIKATIPFSVIVYDYKTLVYKGTVVAISSRNDKGPFNVLAAHTNFITVIENQLILHIDPEHSRFLPLEKGIMRVFDQYVEVYLGIERRFF
ncbi:hypothetical protein C5B42_03165 [Candidatus Cerribacteria bacterium 'Amazon FNV 2010 28 9']|uniref:Uncharacterized protein n=1 Tax=Candidatus Cerribacteria bacterium 'Amazon FNV 2010 28 9' TaxID=2081795 RepID=A0A317JRF0_9BACT|nr:MAG: hypothetical protein C5B42_03165 [Candidatus Cerribacteria bacterium 'Amazon FNV 2010 28 9']